MLSNDAVKLLKWLEKNDQWMTPDEIKNGYKIFDPRDLKSLKDKTMVDKQLNLEGGDWNQYRINSDGKAYLQNLRAQRLPKIREWINFLLPVITFLGGLLASDPVRECFRWLFGLFS